MDKNRLKKNMLFKRKNGEVQLKEQGDAEIKGNSIGDIEQIFRVLAIAHVLFILCQCPVCIPLLWGKASDIL